ncbi:transcriptional regulator, TetR family [Parafrankia sp. EAN1pec]|uniref:TetR/AcrR family transcriptional regulator n=1 Tax=Parafrankia sp. (strain EAN1pec) TaxID=298653 RepID=UPI00015DA0A4|nr:transcriptional regulator, TetR family [Frankia sp. EAN1pec]
MADIVDGFHSDPVRANAWVLEHLAARAASSVDRTVTGQVTRWASRAVADRDGLAVVSMRAVAAALGTSAGSLYRYLSSRGDLLDLMSDRVVGELRPYPPAEADWLDGMLQLAGAQLALYRRHRWLLDVSHQPPGPGPETLAWFDNFLRILEPVRCAPTAKFEAIGMMTGVVSLFVRAEAAAGSFSFAGVDLAAYPHLAAAFCQPPATEPPSNLFERTLRSLLTGLLAAPVAGPQA